MKTCIALALVLAPACALAQPFGPANSEFRVNTTTAGIQANPAAAYYSTGSFLVVWEGQGTSDLFGKGIYAQRFGFAKPLGAEFRVNTYVTGTQQKTRVAGMRVGSDPQWVVVWEGDGEDGDSFGVFGQRVTAAGLEGPEFRVNTYTTGREGYPDVAFDASGSFVVVWAQPDGSDYGIFGRRYSSTGAPLAAPFRVNTYTTLFQRHPAVARSNSGDFVVVWQSYKEFGASYSIVGQRYSSAGAATGGEFRIDQNTSEFHRNAAVAAVGIDQGFVVSWLGQPTASAEVFARRYNSAGVPLTSAFRVNSTTTGDQDYPSIASDSTGGFVVVWISQGQDGDLSGVYAQRYMNTGAPVGGPLRVNTYTTGKEERPRVTDASAGWFTVVWHNNSGEDGSGYGIFGRQFCGLTGDADGNGVINVNDVFYLINNLFASGPAPLEWCDANGDSVVNVNDVFYLINYLFANGPSPACVN